MRASAIFVPFIATLASAATVSINATTSDITSPAKAFQEIVNVPLHELSFSNLSVTALEIVDGSGSGIDAHNVECRMYQDITGLQPGSQGFKVGAPVLISTNVVEIGSLLCYAVESY